MNPVSAYILAWIGEIIMCSLCAVLALFWFPELNWEFKRWFGVALLLRLTVCGKGINEHYAELKAKRG